MRKKINDVLRRLNGIHAVASGLGNNQCFLNSIGILELQALIDDTTRVVNALWQEVEKAGSLPGDEGQVTESGTDELSDLIQELVWYRQAKIPDMQPEYVDRIIDLLKARVGGLEKVAADYGLTVDGVSFALEQYQTVISEITHGRMSKLSYYARDILSVANDVQCNGCELKEPQEPITGETSDGYHTFNELYHHRAVLFSVIVSCYPERAWKAKKHHDGTMYDGMFIVGIETPSGQATYHYDVIPYWDMFKCRELESAPKWDGHTPAQAIERIGKLAGLKAQEPRVMTPTEAYTADFVYVEFDGVITPALRTSNEREGHRESYFATQQLGGEWMRWDDYGITWRCWTSRPTDEQRKAVKWND